MPRNLNRPRLALLGAAAVAALAALASGNLARSAPQLLPAVHWERVSGPNNTGQQLGLARLANGTLHVVWNRGNPPPTDIYDTRFSPSGAKLGTSTVATHWGGSGGLALLAMPDGTLRLFTTGAHTVGDPNGGVNTFTAPASGTAWALDSGAVWGGPPAAAATILGAALNKGGQPVTAWAAAAVSNVQTGVTGGDSTQVCACDALTADIATDAGSGAVIMAGETIGNPFGAYVERALPSPGGRVVLPSATQDAGDSGISGRIGASGVYVAWTDGNRPGVSKPAMHLTRYGGPTRTIAHGSFTFAKVFPGPQGRLWITWGDASDGVFVTRSNRAVGRFEPVQKLTSPPQASFLGDAAGEGSQGALDLFVQQDVAGGGYWHAHVLAEDTLTASVSKKSNGTRIVTFHVTDAGDAVPGAHISTGHGGPLTTSAAGTATLTLHAGAKLHATATAGGYAPASKTVTVS